MMRLLGTADGAVDRPVDAFDGPLAYAGLVYGKGPALYPALRKLTGDGPFFGALRAYVQQNRFRVAPARALIDQIARASSDAAAVRALSVRYLEGVHGDDDLGQLGGASMLETLLGGAGNGLLGN